MIWKGWFKAGIGEHQPEIRTAVVDRSGWLGLKFDRGGNLANAARIEWLEVEFRSSSFPPMKKPASLRIGSRP